MFDAVPVLKLKRGEDRRIRAGHPWVFSNEIDNEATPLAKITPGAAVRIHSDRDQFLGHAYANPHALICARIVGRDVEHGLDRSLIVHRLNVALALRERLSREPYYRLVFGESDGLPGLVLDRYGDLIVGQIATRGMEALRGEVEAAIRSVLSPAGLFWKNDSGARDLEQLPASAEVGFGEVPEEVIVVEGRLHFTAPLRAGQKTGWFYDQTVNRARLARYLWAGARVLDVCSYVGAWATTALAQGAHSATCVDSSTAALSYAERNAAANGVRITTVAANAFDALKQMYEAGERYDIVILDPPAFIKRKKDIPQGQAAYRKLNQLALALIERDGLLVSCSCSYHLSPEDFAAALQAAARHTGRFVQILEAAGQSPDHPVHPAIPETRYLKAFFCRVTRE
ncbi:MAG TPA: class I SAM-dependent rRNA methyltransferase [Steroidobacteraceae bacterium]|jgi:23S rRNA (cytosine1962-C5)-methyltransferase|nr:class I SAM-dependent rRNA methyltransferase [Steroidobacteraceae bacterium]